MSHLTEGFETSLSAFIAEFGVLTCTLRQGYNGSAVIGPTRTALCFKIALVLVEPVEGDRRELPGVPGTPSRRG